MCHYTSSYCVNTPVTYPVEEKALFHFTDPLHGDPKSVIADVLLPRGIILLPRAISCREACAAQHRQRQKQQGKDWGRHLQSLREQQRLSLRVLQTVIERLCSHREGIKRWTFIKWRKLDYTHARTHASTYTHTHARTYAHTHVRAHARAHKHTHTHNARTGLLYCEQWLCT